MKMVGTKRSMVEGIAEKVGVTGEQAREIVQATLDSMIETLATVGWCGSRLARLWPSESAERNPIWLLTLRRAGATAFTVNSYGSRTYEQYHLNKSASKPCAIVCQHNLTKF